MTLTQAIENFNYSSVDDKDVLLLIDLVRKGVKYPAFQTIASKSPFSIDEWSQFLHLSNRTMQRYRKEKKTFDPLQSEKILKITMLYKKGIEVFGDKDAFDTWLSTRNVALGGIQPKSLLDSSFGIDLLKDALTRIEYGVLA